MSQRLVISSFAIPEDDSPRHRAPTYVHYESYQESLLEEVHEELTGQSEVFIPSLQLHRWGTRSQLDENAYCVALVAIVKDIPMLHRQWQVKAHWEDISATLCRLTFACLAMVLNVAFQCAILWYIHIFVAQTSVRQVQELYADYRAANFDEDGHLNEDLWATYELKDDVCQITMSSPPFYFGILLLWVMLMTHELRSCQLLMQDCLSVFRVEKLEDMLVFDSPLGFQSGGRVDVVGFTRCIRWSIMILVIVPRICIALVLLLVGCRWLSSSASFADMTLNCMALQFVKEIDEILYAAVVPRQLKIDVERTDLFKIEGRQTKGDLVRMEWHGNKVTVVWLIWVAVVLFAYACCVQEVLPFDLRELSKICEAQIMKDRTLHCDSWTFLGWSAKCYPYGKLLDGDN
mmetsp:Transcript_119620/g.381718  ORF Transcript_119620/g.381718 Transcript_119620/m.381718 type:complete len:404 (-) Transcript_119620:128-1339(-)